MQQQDLPEQERSFQLSDVWAIVQMQWQVVAACTAATLVLSILFSIFATREYRSTVVLHLSTMAGQEVKSDKVLDLDQYQRWNRGMFTQTQLEVLYSRSLRASVLRELNNLGFTELKPDEAGLGALRGMMEVAPRLGTELLDVSITSPDPELSARLANLIAEVYLTQNLDGMRESARGAKEWVAAQEQDWQDRIDGASRDLLAYQAANGMADVEQQITALSAKQAALAEAHANVSTELALHETTVRTYEKLIASGKYVELSKEMNTPLVASLGTDYARIVTEEARLRERYGDKHNAILGLELERANLEAELLAEVQRTISAGRAKLTLLQARTDTLVDALNRADKELLDMQASRAEYDKLHMEVTRARDFYRDLGQRRGELEMQAQTQLNNIRIIDQARPASRPATPNVPLNLGVGILAGLFLGIAIGLLREYIDDTISSPFDVNLYLKVPFLGMIPKIAGVTDETALALYSHHHPRSTVAESIRAIRTVLELNPTGEAPKRLLITSAVSAEGKTSTIVRLGVAFANLDKRVLMVDGDLRRPRLHKVFGIEKERGLSAVLQGEPIEECIYQTDVPNLQVMPSGAGGERPNELLASAKLARLLDELDTRFDLILIDSPPSVLLSDAQILSRYVDGVIIVAREHAASRMLIRDAIGSLEQVGARVLGVIVNAVDFGHRRTSYKYYYGYGYRYDKYYDDRPGDTAAK